MVPTLEALADAIASLNEWADPDADAYKLRNPGLLRAFTLRHESDANGRRVFPSLIDGYQALLYDLKMKCTGQSRAKLKESAVIVDLLTRGYGHPPAAAEYVLCFLARALPTHRISNDTPIKFFTEGKR